MRFDYSLARQILLFVANTPTPTVQSNYDITIGDIPRLTIDYHIHKLIEEGFLKGLDASSKTDPYQVLEIELTFSGQQFLEKIENDTVWAKVKKYLKENGISISFQAIAAAAQVVLGAH